MNKEELMNSQNDVQLDMFNSSRNFEIVQGNDGSLDGLINAAKVSYIESQTFSWRDLFRGYSDIKVITFSYGLKFVEKVMHLFNTGEVIIGCDKIINRSVAELFAVQEFATNHIAKNKYLQKRINDGEFRFYVVKDFVSHQKIYLLSDNDKRFRTIFGSANMSEIAWNGEQIESYFYCDDKSLYSKYLEKYCTLRDMASDKISIPALSVDVDDDSLTELPIMKSIEKNSAVVIRLPDNEDEPEYAFTVDKGAKKWNQYVKEAKLKPEKNGFIKITTKHIDQIKKTFLENQSRKKEREKINPPFEIDYNRRTISFKNKLLNLSPSEENVQNDIRNLIEYMNGFDQFTNDTTKLKRSYWKVLNYMFLSPFMARLRWYADTHDYDSRFFPIYLLLQGVSDAGKTAFVETVQKLMYGESLPKLDKTFFSAKPMTSLKENVKGCTILIDELTPMYWKYARDIVKADDYLANQGYINHPAFVITSNEVKSIAPDLSKRIIYINVNNRLGKQEAAMNDRYVSNIRNSMGNSFYCEYLSRMFDATDKLIDEMISCSDKHWYPDIFKISADIIMEIIVENGFDLPSELEKFEWIDYMGETVISEKAINMLMDEYEHNNSIFKVNKKNELEIDFSGYEKSEAETKVRVLQDELPAKLECRAVGLKIILNNQFIKEYLGVNIKRTFLDKLKGK